jgi:hypothetical protein
MMNHLSLLMSCIRDTQQISCSLSLTCQIKKKHYKRKDQSYTLIKNQCYDVLHVRKCCLSFFFSSLASITIKYLFE